MPTLPPTTKLKAPATLPSHNIDSRNVDEIQHDKASAEPIIADAMLDALLYKKVSITLFVF